jgi:hypothetical protein
MTRRTGADDGQLGFFDIAAQAVTDFFGSATRAEPEEPELDEEDEQDAEDADDLARAADTLLVTLRGMGLQHVRTIVLTRNRSVVVSLKGFELRLHEGFCTAPVEIHAQIV